MRFLISLLWGSASGVVAVMLHQSLPPVGVVAGITLTYISIWLVGRNFHRRIYKWIAALGWIAVILRASTFGVGEELLVQADGVGSTLLIIGTLSALAAVAARI
ncbi:MAG: hypothetical protein ACKOVI_03390 [Candidatus Planktophila sp.]